MSGSARSLPVRHEAVAAWYRESFARRFVHRRAPAAASVILIVFLVFAVGAPYIAPYDPHQTDFAAAYSGPSAAHWFGTDYLGRDILSRVIHGTRASLIVGACSVVVGSLIGLTVGVVSGYWRGRVDGLLMRVIDTLAAFPTLILALGIVAVLGPGMRGLLIAIGVTSIPVYARLSRASTMSVRTLEFVTAAVSNGAADTRIMVRHVLPNIVGPVVVAMTLGLANAVLAESALSFLGVGIAPPTPTWGGDLSQGFRSQYISPWMSIFPGAAIFLLVLSVNLVGDGVRDAVDVRLRNTP